MDKHTNSRWVADGYTIYTTLEDGSDISIIENALTAGNGTTFKEDIANMERAALCVNFCDRYSNEDLIKLGTLFETIKSIRDLANKQWLDSTRAVVDVSY